MKHSASPTWAGGVTLAAATALLVACAAAAPSERMETSAATIRAAQEVGAAKVPRAALHVQLAREQAEHAKRLVEEGGDDRRAQAESLLMRAQADADLALALAREDVDRIAAQQALDNVHSIQASK